jgi:sugar phosphate isomerase/epimerase
MEASQSLSRRRFLAVGAGAAAAFTAAGLVPGDAWAHGGHRHGRRKPLIPKRRIGIQLFTVRDLLTADAAGTLAALAEIGYREVEVAGVPAGQTAASFRALLDQNGMRAIGNHHFTGPALVPLFGDRPVEEILDEAETLGQKYTGTAAMSIPPGVVEGVGEPQTAERYKQLAELANQWGEAAAARGLRFYAHLHYWDFGTDPTTGEVLFQVMADETDEDLVWFEPDIFWMVFGDVDPLDWIPCFQDRFPLFHAKDGFPNPAGGYFNPGFTDLGEGEIDFSAIFGALDDPSRHHFIVERDDQPHPLQTAEIAYDYLLDLRAPKHRRRGGDCGCDDDHDGGRHEGRRPAVR